MKSGLHHLKNVRLDEICRLVTDGTHDSPKLQPHGVPFIKGKHISGGFVDFENCDFITEDDHRKAILRSKPESGDILFSNIGSVGDAAYVGTRKEFSIKNVALFKPDYTKVDSRYLYYVVIGPEFRGELMSKRQGAAQPFFSLAMLRSHQVRYHEDIIAQKKIAAILSAYDELIANNERRIRILEEMAQNLYQEWFVKFRFPGHKKVKMVDSPLGKIPQGWESAVLGDLCGEIRRGVEPSQLPTDTPYIGLEHMPRKSIVLAEWGTLDGVQSTKLRFKAGEILFGKIRPYFHKVGVALTDGVCSTDAIVIVPKRPDAFPIVLGCVSSDEFVSHATRTSQGTKMPRANWDVLTRYPICVASDDVMERFNSFMDDTVKLIRPLALRNRLLRQTRDLLLPKLISGEVDVSALAIQTEG